MIFGRGLGMLSAMSACARTARWFGLALALSSVGCAGGTETGNPSIAGQLSYTGTSSAPEKIGVREGGSVATVQNAWFELAAVKISSEGGCGLSSSEAFTIDALGVGDHAAGNHNSTAFEATPGRFCTFELPFVRVDATKPEAPAELRRHAIVLAGELADGTPFSIESDQNPVVRLHGPASGFQLAAGEANALVAFDFAVWLQNLDFTAATIEDARITVSEALNRDLLRAFEERVADGVTLYRDADADGVLDVDAERLATPR